jgi:hypothetical protein
MGSSPSFPPYGGLKSESTLAQEMHGWVTMTAYCIRAIDRKEKEALPFLDFAETDLPTLDLKKALEEPSFTVFIIQDEPDEMPFFIKQRLSGLINVVLNQAQESRERFLKGEISQPPQKTILYDNDKIPVHQDMPGKIWKSTGWASVVSRSPSTDWVKDNEFMSDYSDSIDVLAVLPTSRMEAFIAAKMPETIRERLLSGESLMWGTWSSDEMSPTRLIKSS